MIVAKLERKQSQDGRAYLAGRTVQDVEKGSLLMLRKVSGDKYELLKLAPNKLNTRASAEVF